MRDIAEAPSRPAWVSALIRWGSALVAAVLVGLAAAYGVQRYRASKADAAAPQYYLVAAGTGPVSVTVSGAGTVEPVETQDVAAATAGQVSKLDVVLGQSVQAGEPLLQLADTQDLEQQVMAAQAALAEARAQLQSLTDPTAGQDPRVVTQAQIQVQQAQIALQEAQLALGHDQAAAAADAAVTTPVAGTVLAVDVAAGQQVGAGAPLISVQPAGAPNIVVPVSQDALPFLPVGASAVVTVPSLARTFSASVSAVGSAPVSAAATPSGPTPSLYPVTLTVPQLPGDVPDGASATVVFTPEGNPPTAYTWTDAGQVDYPAPLTVAAAEAGTVSDLVAVGAEVKQGQSLGTVTAANTQQMLQQADLVVQQDRIALKQAQLTVQGLVDPTPATAQAVATAQAQVAQDAQELKQAQQALADLVVASPIAGTVTVLDVAAGDSVHTGTALMKLQSNAGLQVVTPVDELDIGEVKPGQAVQVTANAFPGTVFAGTVATIAPSAVTSNGVSTYPVTVALRDAQNLLAGMSVNATIQVASAQDVLRVPAQAVTTFGGSGRGIVRVMQNGQAVPTPVQVGLIGAEYAQIRSGLRVGQQVVAGRASSVTNFGALFRAAGGFRGPGGAGRGPGAPGGGR